HRNLVAGGVEPARPFRMFGHELYRERGGVRYIASRYGELYPLDKAPGTYRIVVLGGSTTENKHTYELKGYHCPLLVQQQLREQLGRDDIEAINIANSAYATPHALILLELDVLSWQPDLIVVSHNVNDLLAAYWPNPTFDYANKYSHPFYGVPDIEHIYTPANIVFQHSQLYWVVRDGVEQLTASGEWPPLQRRSYGSEPPALVAGAFERNLRSIVALAQANGIDVLLGTQPLQPSEPYFLRHMAYKSYNDVVVYPEHDEFVQHHRAFNEIIRRVARETGVYLADNDPVLNGEERYFIDFVHYTPLGVTRLAENVTDVIVEQGIVDK
ncbi:MAG: SGNH/GDSL hydrolase family protein, partial [Anaerolineae bacterium]|nr:SGNH/GDSL hydrolase family protein [Anaerolineae bacterium]